MGIVDKLKRIPDIHFKENEKMSDKTSLGVGGNARYFVMPESVHSLIACIAAAKDSEVKYKIIGNGTDIIVSDRGYDGLIIRTTALNGILSDRGETIAMCGAPLSKLAAFCVGSGRTGAEGLAGIPATVGGAICRNAGAFGFSISDRLVKVVCVENGEVKVFSKTECNFSYRSSAFLGGDAFIASATFRFPRRRGAVKAEIKDYNAVRRAKQPTGRTCGSVFINPEGDYAGRLIEAAGLKGFEIGGAVVSDRHANFIIAKDGATAKDVVTLINEIKRTVYDKFGVRLKEEAEYLGEF